MSEENGSGIVDTGLGGGCLFEFVLEQDPLQVAAGAPRRYQRVDILAGDQMIGGLVVGVVQVVLDGVPSDTYVLRIAADREGARDVAAAVADGTVAVRLIG